MTFEDFGGTVQELYGNDASDLKTVTLKVIKDDGEIVKVNAGDVVAAFQDGKWYGRKWYLNSAVL